MEEEDVAAPPQGTKRPRHDTDANVSTVAVNETAPPLPFCDVLLENHSHAHLRVFILPNAWICTRIYTHDAHLFKKSTFSFPRMDRVLGDSSVVYELEEWNGRDAVNYDMVSIALVLAEVAGDETKLRALAPIHIEGRWERVLKCLQSKK